MSTKKANLILTTCSMAWGTSYIFMKLGIEGLSPLMLMALRTGIAFLILVLIFFKRLLNVNKRLLLYSAITGFLLFTNLTPILYGLNTITASQSGFILSTDVYKRQPSLRSSHKLPHALLEYASLPVSYTHLLMQG